MSRSAAEVEAEIKARANAATEPEPEHPFLRAAREFAASLAALDCKPRTVQHTIDGVCYTSTKFAFTVGVELFPRITALVGNGVARALATGQGLDEIDIGEIAAAVVGVSERAMRDGLMPIVRDLLSRVQCGSLAPGLPVVGALTPAALDEHFAGEYIHVLKVCVFALAHNYRGPTFGVR
jgi:hypothetical protein